MRKVSPNGTLSVNERKGNLPVSAVSGRVRFEQRNGAGMDLPPFLTPADLLKKGGFYFYGRTNEDEERTVA